MNNKSVMIIIIAALLALISAFFLIKKDNNKILNIEEENQIQQEVINFQTEVDSSAAEEVVIEKDNVVKEVKPSAKPAIKETIKEKQVTEPVFEKIVVQEGSVVEEVEDHGIRRNDDGTYEITREFKMKSPTKYSFVDFGFLEKVTK